MVNVGVKLRDKERNRGTFMALKKKPVTGMKDILPAEMQIREYVMNQIRETYGLQGTPIRIVVREKGESF